jgi:nucleotide-binding universal stress UspA family protein
VVFEIGTDGIGGLVVGFDGSDPSLDALAFSLGIARRNGATLTIVYVVERGLNAMATLAPGGGGVAALTGQDAVERIGIEVERAVGDLGVTWDFVTVWGDPALALEAVAVERRLDVIVVGRSRSRLHRRLGSIPARLLRTAQRPVTVVP